MAALRTGGQHSCFVPNAAPATKLGTVPAGKRVHLQVLTANCTIRLAGSREELDTARPGIGPGLQIKDTNGPVEIQWSGEIYAEGLAANPSSPVEVSFGILVD